MMQQRKKWFYFKDSVKAGSGRRADCLLCPNGKWGTAEEEKASSYAVSVKCVVFTFSAAFIESVSYRY